MTDSRPIGIFDSGIGGLTVTKEIISVLPNESLIYIGDTARVPYGNRSNETVIRFSLELAHKLVELNVKAIVVACATASSVALDTLQQTFPQIPIIGVIKSSALEAASQTKSKHIGIIGTRATINSKSFETALLSNNPKLKIYSQSCPLFVPIIEEGLINQSQILEPIVDHYLNQFTHLPIDTMILGCTHYPLIAHALNAYLPQVKLINTGKSVAHELKTLLSNQQLLTTHAATPHHTFYVTDLNPNFSTTAKLFIQQSISIEKIDL